MPQGSQGTIDVVGRRGTRAAARPADDMRLVHRRC